MHRLNILEQCVNNVLSSSGPKLLEEAPRSLKFRRQMRGQFTAFSHLRICMNGVSWKVQAIHESPFRNFTRNWVVWQKFPLYSSWMRASWSVMDTCCPFSRSFQRSHWNFTRNWVVWQKFPLYSSWMRASWSLMDTCCPFSRNFQRSPWSSCRKSHTPTEIQ